MQSDWGWGPRLRPSWEESSQELDWSLVKRESLFPWDEFQNSQNALYERANSWYCQWLRGFDSWEKITLCNMNFVPSLLTSPPLFPCYGRQNNGSPKISSLNTQNLCYLTREKDFMRDDKIKGLGMGRLSWISRWTLSAITCILIRGRQREIWTHTGEDCMKQAREIWRCWPRVLGWCHHKPRNTRNPPELEEARNGFSHRASWVSVALPTLCDFDIWYWTLTSRTVR